MSKSLTTEEVRALLARAVQEKGEDYVYEMGPEGQCDYFRSGVPSCIVGHVFSYIGLTAEDLEPIEGYHAQQAIRDLRLDLTPEVTHALYEAQNIQDSGKTWGEALEAFEQELGQ